MTMTSSATEIKVQALLAVLDEDIRHVETVLTQLEALRSLLVQRDDAGLERLLEASRQQAQVYAAHEQQRQDLRRDLAARFGWRECDVTLSKLQGRLSGPSRAAVAGRQARLKALVERLKREHTLTTVLLVDCARFNRLLLQALFGVSHKGTMSYSATGAAKHSTGRPLMNLRF
jgi:hypothetical protein